jgi:hypothetical protein
MSTVDYSIIEKFVQYTLADCESIISETENVEEYISADSLDDLEFIDIRNSAEQLETLVISMSESELVTNDMLTEIDDMSIELYQNIKYISDVLVLHDVYDSEVIESFRNMTICIDGIRGNVKHFVVEFK